MSEAITNNPNRVAMPPMPGISGMHGLLKSNLPTPATLMAASEKSMVEMTEIARYVESNAYSVEDNSDVNRPQLTPPASSAAEKIANGDNDVSLFSLLIQIQELLTNTELVTLKSRITVFNQIANSRKAALEDASLALDNALKELDVAKEQLKNAESDLSQADTVLGNANKDVAAAQNALKVSENILRKAQAAVDAAPNDQGAINALSDAKKGYQQSQARLTQMETNVVSAKQAQESAKANALTAVDRVNAALATVNECTSDLPATFIPTTQIYNLAEKAKSSMQIMMECMLKLQEIFDKDRDSTLKNRMELYQKRQEITQAKLMVEAEKRIAAAKKAEKLGKIGTLLANFLGALMTVLGVASSVFSGGASFLLATAGTALMAVDSILEATIKTSLTAIVMGGMMEKIIMPFIEMIAEAIMKQMEKDGFSDQASAAVGYILAVLTTLVTVAVSALLIKSAASPVMSGLSKLGAMIGDAVPIIAKGASALSQKADDFVKSLDEILEKFVEGFLKKTVSKNMLGEEAILEATKGLSKEAAEQAVEKLMDELVKDLAKNIIPNVLEFVQSVLMSFLSIVETALGGVTANYQKKSLEATSEITLLKSDLDSIKKMLDRTMKDFVSAMKTPDQFTKLLSSTLESRLQTSTFILNNIRA